MPRIPVHTVDSAPEASRAILSDLGSRIGKVLNIHGEMAHSPAVLHVYAATDQAIAEHSSLDAATREAIALAVGVADDCGYCQAAHTVAGKAAGLSGDLMMDIRAGAVSDAPLAALVTLASEATGNVGAVSDRTWQAARDAGWSDRELTDAFASIAANLFTNYFNHFIGTELDLPEAPDLES